jgi:hypothetical protein
MKPVCYMRYLNGEPDWGEDCITVGNSAIDDHEDDADHVWESVPLYGAPPAQGTDAEKDARIAELTAERDHFAALACDDLGKNPPIWWKARALEAEQRIADLESRTAVPDVEAMVDRFLGWKLPQDFAPDAGISFNPVYNEKSPWGPMRHEPVGTNLFNAEQARAMVEYMLAAAPNAQEE